MARLPRLAVPGHPHYLLQRGNNRQKVVVDDDDRRLCLELLREAALVHGVAIHAYALLDCELHILVTPGEAEGTSRMMQSLGRRYVGAFNRRHRRSGTLWEGRFRAAVIESERYLLPCMCHIELGPVRMGNVTEAGAYVWSSAAHHLGLRRDPLVSDHSLYWAMGNTPFEREHAYRMLMERGLSMADHAVLSNAAEKGWALGSEDFVKRLASLTDRRLRPLQRGRPRRLSTPSPFN